MKNKKSKNKNVVNFSRRIDSIDNLRLCSYFWSNIEKFSKSKTIETNNMAVLYI
jgi:hypothetical protein